MEKCPDLGPWKRNFPKEELMKFLRGRDKAQNLESHRQLEFIAQERRELCRQNSKDLQWAQLTVSYTNQHKY